MRKGDLVRTNFFGEENSFGILLNVMKMPPDALEYYTCKVLLTNGTIRKIASSHLFTASEMEQYGIPQ